MTDPMQPRIGDIRIASNQTFTVVERVGSVSLPEKVKLFPFSELDTAKALSEKLRGE